MAKENKELTVREVISKATLATKGANVKLGWRRNCKVKKSCQDQIEKEVQAVGRIGIDYDNQKIVQEKRESGELPEQSQPIWNGKGEWILFPYLIRHTVTGQLYLRLYKGTGTAKAKVQYYLNGQPVNMDVISSMLLSSEKQEKTGDCFCCKIEDITAISWEPRIDREPVKEHAEQTEVTA